MSLVFEKDILESNVKNIASKMMLAARTAPKAKGIDNLVMALADKDEIKKIAGVMHELAKTNGRPSFIRDAENILRANALFLIGTKLIPLGLNCGLCGFSTCQEKMNFHKQPCVFNTGDLGIALGSAVSIAMDHRIDNRIMYSVGIAVAQLKILGNDVGISYGVPLSISGKNIFFDRT